MKACPKCGLTLLADALAGLCPRCLLLAGLDEPGDAARIVGSRDSVRESDSNQLNEPTISRPSADLSIAPPSGTIVRYFGNYELLKEIARGGMGVVYKARQLRLNRLVAVKMILSGSLASDVDLRRFQTEAEAAARLDHPGIVPIFEVGQHEGQYFYSMGLIDGESLAQRLARGAIAPRSAAQLVQSVALAVQHAHDHGVIHRDLKPANILLDRAGQPHVLDFGLARCMTSDSDLTIPGQILGTPGYMSPEQASGASGQASGSADVYALGAILYAALTGRAPFSAESAAKTILQVIHDEPTPPRKLDADIPVDLEAICLKCLEKSSSKRYPTASALEADLSRFLNHRAITARRPSIAGRALRWSQRNRRHLTVVLATTVIALACMTGYRWITEWYRNYRSGNLTLTVNSGPTKIKILRAADDAPVRSVTVDTKMSFDLPSGEYEIWAERYGKRWKVHVLQQLAVNLDLSDNSRHDFSLRTEGYIHDSHQINPVRYQDRTDLLTSSYDRGRIVLELHDGWNGKLRWSLEIPTRNDSDDTVHPEIRGGAATMDLDGKGSGDVALLKAGRYIVVSNEAGRVILDKRLESVPQYTSSPSALAEFRDVNKDNVPDIVLVIESRLLAFDGRDGSRLWETALDQEPEQFRVIATKEDCYLTIVNSCGSGGDKESALLTYSLADGILKCKSTLSGDNIELLGVLSGAEEPLVFVNHDLRELEGVGAFSGKVRWKAPEKEWSRFTLRDIATSWPGTLALEDLTGDGVTDAVMALPAPSGDPCIQLMMIDGGKTTTVWRSRVDCDLQLAIKRPAVFADAADAPGESGRLYCVNYKVVPESKDCIPRLNFISPKSGQIRRACDLPPLPDWIPVQFLQSVDGSKAPALALSFANDYEEFTVLQLDKETGVPFRRLLLDRFRTPIQMLADINHDGLSDLVTGQLPSEINLNGVAPVNVSVYGGQPHEIWRRAAAAIPLSDLDGDGVADCVTFGPASNLVSGSSGETLQQLVAFPHDPKAFNVAVGISDRCQRRLAVRVVEDSSPELGKLVTSATAIDVANGNVIADIDDHLKGFWNRDPLHQIPTELYFPDIDGDGQAEVAVSGQGPWRIYSAKSGKRLFSGTGLASNRSNSSPPPSILIGFFSEQDVTDRLVEASIVGQLVHELPVRAIDNQGKEIWASQLPISQDQPNQMWKRGVLSDDFDDDGIADLILWLGSNLWVLDQKGGKLKMHATINGSISLPEVAMIRTENGLPALVAPHRMLISPNGKITRDAYVDVIRHSGSSDSGEVLVWLKENGCIVAFSSDGTTKLWEQQIPEMAAAGPGGMFARVGELTGAVVVLHDDDLFAMDLLTGKQLWRSRISLDETDRIYLVARKNSSIPLVLGTSKAIAVCREAYPVDANWNYLLPGGVNDESSITGSR